MAKQYDEPISMRVKRIKQDRQDINQRSAMVSQAGEDMPNYTMAMTGAQRRDADRSRIIGGNQIGRSSGNPLNMSYAGSLDERARANLAAIQGNREPLYALNRKSADLTTPAMAKGLGTPEEQLARMAQDPSVRSANVAPVSAQMAPQQAAMPTIQGRVPYNPPMDRSDEVNRALSFGMTPPAPVQPQAPQSFDQFFQQKIVQDRALADQQRAQMAPMRMAGAAGSAQQAVPISQMPRRQAQQMLAQDARQARQTQAAAPVMQRDQMLLQQARQKELQDRIKKNQPFTSPQEANQALEAAGLDPSNPPDGFRVRDPESGNILVWNASPDGFDAQGNPLPPTFDEYTVQPDGKMVQVVWDQDKNKYVQVEK